jgi:SWI/SNF-related matrix-associated actin-dependent regulator 1 of chromatin subfamily A
LADPLSQLTAQARLQHRLMLQRVHGLDDTSVIGLLHRYARPDAEGNEPLASLRRQLGEAKIPLVVTWAIERFDCGIKKLLLFCWHHSVANGLYHGLAEYSPVMLTGETSPVGRVNAIDAFQHRREIQVFIGQLQAAGTGITLTAASEVGIVEPSWVPSENVQAIARAHRLGQRDSVLASFLYLPGTLDEIIMRTFRRKAADLADLLENQVGERETDAA